MKYPDRTPKERSAIHLGLPYYDSEKVRQEDGKIAEFLFSSALQELGWVFQCYLDE